MSMPKGMVSQKAALPGRKRRAAHIAVAPITPPKNVARATPTNRSK